MYCPTCKTQNPDHRKFCGECGAQLVLLCPECSAENQPSDKFCGECGCALYKPPVTSLPEPRPVDTKADTPSKGYPPVDGERKQVTVLFSDLSDLLRSIEANQPLGLIMIPIRKQRMKPLAQVKECGHLGINISVQKSGANIIRIEKEFKQ